MLLNFLNFAKLDMLMIMIWNDAKHQSEDLPNNSDTQRWRSSHDRLNCSVYTVYLIPLHCFSKNDTDTGQPILIVFGRDVACYQTMICYPISPN